MPAATIAAHSASAGLGRHGDLDPRLARVAGAGHRARHVVPRRQRHLEPADFGGGRKNGAHEGVRGRTLHGEDGTGTGDVVATHRPAHVVGVRGVRHHVEHRPPGVVGVPPHDDVVEHRRVGLVEQMGVLRPPGTDLAEIVGECVLDDVEGIVALEPHGAEVGHVEDRRR